MPVAGVDLPRALGGRRKEATTPSLSCARGLGPAEGAGPFGQLLKAQSRSGIGGIRRGNPQGLGGIEWRPGDPSRGHEGKAVFLDSALQVPLTPKHSHWGCRLQKNEPT